MKKILRSFVPASIQPVQLQKRSEGQMPLITGYGAVFYQEGREGTEYWLWNDVVERIDNQAFNRAVQEDDVRALMNHNPDLLLGRSAAGTLKLSVDATGLRYEIEPPDTQAGRDTVKSIERGDLTGSSFSFSILEENWRKETKSGSTINIRTLTDVQVYDVGPVTFPAYSATTTGTRQLRCIGDNREEEAREAIGNLKPTIEVISRDMVDFRCREIEMQLGGFRKRG